MRKILSLILSGILLAGNLWAQEPVTNAQYSIDDFSLGLVTQIAPQGLPKGAAVICENLRLNNELKSLEKREKTVTYGSPDASEAITSLYRLYLKDGTKVLLTTHGDEVETGNDNTGAFTKILDLSTGGYRWQWLTWHNIAIGMDGYNYPVKYDGSSASATYLGTCLATVSATAGNPSGTYTYKVSFYTATYEVVFGTASNSVSPSSKKVTLTMIPIAPDTFLGEDVVGRKVYRVQSGTWKLLSNGDIADNTTVTLLDNDTTAAGASYPTVDNSTIFSCAPPKGKFPLINNNRLFIAGNPTYPSAIYYSEDACPDVFYADSYWNVRLDDGDSITFIKNLLGILTIGKNNTIQKFYTDGDTPSSDWELSDPFSFIGCQAPYTAVNSPIGIIYLARDGLYVFNGQNSSLISGAVTPEIKDISQTNFETCWGEFFQNAYHLAYTSTTSGSATNNRILILIVDMITRAYTKDLLDINCMAVFGSGTDTGVLYYGESDDGNIYSYSETIHEVVHRKHSDFTGTWDDARYIPVRRGGNANSPIIEIARTETVDELTGTIDELTGTIDREDTDGSYISQTMSLTAESFDRLYWNERMPAVGGDVTFAIRTGAADPPDSAWSDEFTDPSGSDISGVTTNDYFQYRISLTTNDESASPQVYNAGQYVVRIVYNVVGSTAETSIPIHWQSGWLDLGYPGYTKTLKKFYIQHEGTAGTLSVKFTAQELNQETRIYEETTDTFNIDLAAYPNYYTDYFTNGKFPGELFQIDITNDDLNKLRIKRIVLILDVEPMI